MRTWGSINVGHGIRVGRSYGPEDFGPPRLLRYRRYELRQGLMAAAKARGADMDKEEADYLIDKALAVGLLDRNGDLDINVKGSRDECIDAIVETTAQWGRPMPRDEAAKQFDRVARRKDWPDVATILIYALVWGVLGIPVLIVIFGR